TELRRPLVETVETLTQQLATLARAAESMRQAAGAVAQSTGTIRQGVLAEESEVSGGLEATESLARVSRRVSEDGTEAAQASSTARGSRWWPKRCAGWRSRARPPPSKRASWCRTSIGRWARWSSRCGAGK